MKLQAKIGVALLCSFLMLLGAAYAILQVAVTPKFERLETEMHTRAIARIRANVESVRDDMQARALDYAH